MQRIKSLAELARTTSIRTAQVLGQTTRKLTNKTAPENINADKDEFGTLSERGCRTLNILAAQKYLPEDSDNYDKLEYDLEPRKNAYYYKYEITKYARQGPVGLRKALELFHTMKQKDRLKPDYSSFTPLIYGCARAGYTKKAFELYNESLKYIAKPSRSVVTCLINACAESPFPEYGLERLKWLRPHLKICYNFEFNKVHYHALIKAYGKLGQLDEASKLVKEMIENQLFPETDTFNMLLIGCASDKERGSTLALKVYKRMKLYDIRPDVITYRLILRCIRDCGVGSPQFFQQTVGELPALTPVDQKLIYKSRKKRDKSEMFEWAPLLGDLGESIEEAVKPTPNNEKSVDSINTGSNLAILNVPHNQIMLSSELTNNFRTLPNLLSSDHLDLINKVEAIQIDKLSNGANRLFLFGGMHGFLKTMTDDHCKPDNKTFSLLLDCIRRTNQESLEYYRLARDYSIQRDLLFYDLLIRHICEKFRDPRRLEFAQYFIDQMLQEGIRPNISTFESLSKGCHTLIEAKQFISDVENAGFVVSDIIMKNFFESAILKKDFFYINGLIELSQERRFKPKKQLIESLEGLRLEARELLFKIEKNIISEGEKPEWMLGLKVGTFDKFTKLLSSWLSSVGLLEDEHPWKQFHVESQSRRKGFTDFVENFKTLEKVKRDVLAKGGKFGNLTAKANRLSSGKYSVPKDDAYSHGAMNRQKLSQI